MYSYVLCLKSYIWFMLILFQILFTLFVLFAIVSVVKKKRESLLGPKGMIFWIVFWLAALVAVLWPNALQMLAEYVGIGRGVDLVIYVALVIIFFALFKLNINIEGLDRQLTKVVRKDSLDK